MLRKLLVSLCLVSLLTIGTGAMVASAHATPNYNGCYYASWGYGSNSYSGYHVTIHLYRYQSQSGAYCGNWYAEANVTINPEYGGGYISGFIYDGNGNVYKGSSSYWGTSSSTQYRSSNSPKINTTCAEGHAHVQLNSGTVILADTGYVCS